MLPWWSPLRGENGGTERVCKTRTGRPRLAPSEARLFTPGTDHWARFARRDLSVRVPRPAGWCRRALCWNSMWRNLQRHEDIVSGGEVNCLIDGRCGERLPAIDLAHVDLTGGEQ